MAKTLNLFGMVIGGFIGYLISIYVFEEHSILCLILIIVGAIIGNIVSKR